MRISHEEIERFAGWSADRNPLHVDADAARRTWFGRPIVHGVLAAVHTLRAGRFCPRQPPRRVRVEFRSAVYPDAEYHVQSRNDAFELRASLRSADAVVLTVRSSDAAGTDEDRFSTSRPVFASDGMGTVREGAQDHADEAFERGLEATGRFETAAPPESYLASGLHPLQLRILALCSYVVGMEVPGLRSLFTQLDVRFGDDLVDSADLRYRVRTVRFDRQFRILDTRLEVESGGRLLAIADLRSYVRFSQSGPRTDVLSRVLAPEARSLAGKVAVVCGGTRGLGAELTAALAVAGCHVYATYRTDAAAAQELTANLQGMPGTLELLQGDAGDNAWCEAARKQILRDHGGVDILVLNACAPPAPLRITAESIPQFSAYIESNLPLSQVPAAVFLPALESRCGTLVAISSSFVSDPPAGFAHYVALKQAVEDLVRTAARERPKVRTIIARPPRLRTGWNDTPTGVLGAIEPDRVAVPVVNRIAGVGGDTDVLTEFPPLAEADREGVADPEFTLSLAASFTAEPLLTRLRFWFTELDLRGDIDVAPYGQILQTLLAPPAPGRTTRGMHVFALRLRDWLRELPREDALSDEFLRRYLQDMARDFDRAVRTHRAQASVATLIVLCPSLSSGRAVEDSLIAGTEARLIEALRPVPGLQVIRAADFHDRYAVTEERIGDTVRDRLAHVPYSPAYLDMLSALIMRHLHRTIAPAPKVVAVDCDNTLWRGVVGEVGPEGVEFDESHAALHAALVRLHHAGVLIALCSKNEEADVWRVFDTRSDFGLKREQIVAAAINWHPKSENLRVLASRLNLGLDSFIFIDDNPVECAEVRAACPEVLTLEWPQEPARARRLVEHTWEFDPRGGTAEDQRRTELYREEFNREELRAQTLTFRDFIESLGLSVEISPLTPEDLPRAAQLTIRTNQFNFTTRRREQADLQALVAAGTHDVRTVRVGDRFGDYGLVGLLITEVRDARLAVDTFLLSCRVLGRGVEHRMAAELGRIALERGASTIGLRVEPTKRNTPARKFLEAIAPARVRTTPDGVVEAEVDAPELADVRFEPADTAAAGQTAGERPAPRLPQTLIGSEQRLREHQIARTAYNLVTPGALSLRVEGRPQLSTGTSAEADAPGHVYEAFANVLGLSTSRIRELDSLEALGCDSFKIVEITVNLLERFPDLPSTLLFEHRTVSEIARRVGGLSQPKLRVQARSPIASRPSERHEQTDGLAVVGMHLRCAGARSPAELWSLLSSGQVAVEPVPPDRKHFLGRLEDTRPHWAGLIEDVDRFDADAFGIAPREAELMDPQLRLFLEVASAALEDAGGLGESHDVDTGVFAGVMYGDYAYRANILARNSDNPYKCWEGFSLANRLSQILGFRGPSLAVDTACSSSATALHLACRALEAGDCSVAVAGGVNLILDPDRFVQLGRLGILSLTGRCLAFGSEADGTILGEGAGVVVLRRLEDARRRGDRIYGVIKATGLSTGSGTVGFTAPNPQAQAEAIRRSIEAAGIDPRTITYVETHGTGTALGDPIEVRGLTLAYTNPDLWDVAMRGPHRCSLGSIKPNVGHLEAGAGVLGLIKVLLQLQRGMLVPSVTSKDPNPQIPFPETPFTVQRALAEWERPVMEVNGVSVTLPRRAGLSSFGVGGSNVHVIVEEPPCATQSELAPERPHHILTVSARSEDSLRRRLADLEHMLDTRPDVALPDVCFSANTGRRHFERRVAVVADSREQLIRSLRRLASGDEPAGSVRGTVPRSGPAPRIAFLFTGQGSQYAGMGRRLYETQPIFRRALDRCAEIFDSLLDQPLLGLLFAADGTDEARRLNQTGYTQPALFAFEYALSQLWASWGIRPDVVLGHSVGEIGAMSVAGGLSLDDGLKLIAARGRLMQALPAGGAMTSVMAPEPRVAEAIAGRSNRVAIAAINGPQHVVISGDGVAVAEISGELTAEGIKTKGLVVSHAFHSPLMVPMIAEYQRVVNGIRFSKPRVAFVSCVHGRLADTELTSPEYWIRNVLDPVRFTDGMAALDALLVKAFVEIGPQPVLLGMGRQCVRGGDDRLWLPSMKRDADPWPALLTSLGALYTAGADVDWRGFDDPYARRRVSLPAYPFAKKRYWISGSVETISVGGLPQHEVVDAEPSAAGPACYDIEWRKAPALGEPADTSAAGRWLVLSDERGTGAALASALERRGARCTTVLAARSFAKAGPSTFRVNPAAASDLERVMREIDSDGKGIRGVVHLWALDESSDDDSSEDPAERGRMALDAAVAALQAVTRRSAAGGPTMWMVTRGAVAVPESGRSATPVALAQTSLWGLGRTFALEHPDLWGGLIDLHERSTSSADADLLVRELLSKSGEDQVALRDGHRYVPRLAARQLASRGTVALSASGTYLVTGGLGALGLCVARSLVSRGARHLVLTGRRGLAAAGAEAAVRELESLGAEVRVVAADISRPDGIAAVFERIDPSVPLNGIVHAAGVDETCPIRELTRATLDSVVPAKMQGAWLLHERTKDIPLDFFVSFSSIASVLGSAGRGPYAAANAFLDGLARERRRMGVPALTVNWGPWSGGGMATDTALQQYRRVGNRGLDPDAAIQLLERLIATDETQVTVADVDWDAFRMAYEALRPRPLVSELRSAKAASAGPGAPSDQAPWVERLLAVSADKRAAELAVLLRSELAKTLGFDTPEDVPVDQTFHDMGMDSLMSADFAQRLQKRLGIRSTALVFQYPYVETLATHLLEKLALTESDRAGATPASAAESAETAATPSAPESPSVETLRTTTGYSPDVESRVFDFQKLAWPQRRSDWIAPRWRWMFVESARRLGIEPQVWLHCDNGNIVGHNGAIPVRVKIGDDERLSAWLVDTMVLEEYRSQAVGARLMVEAHDALPFALSLGQTDQMREIQLRLGWEQVAPLRTAQLLVRPERVLKGKLPAAAAVAASLGLRASSAFREAWRGRPEGVVQEIAGFDASHDGLWDEMSRTVTCAVRRDACYMNWKYVDQPGQEFRRLALVRNGVLRGVVVLMFRDPDEAYGYRRGFLVDLVAPLTDERLVVDLVRVAVQNAADAKADAVLCLHISPHLTDALRQNGFLLRQPSRHLLVRPGPIEGSSLQHLRAAADWYVTHGDSDIDRPW